MAIGSARRGAARPAGVTRCSFTRMSDRLLGRTTMALRRAAIDAILRYHHEQGLTERRLTIEEIFVPDLLDR